MYQLSLRFAINILQILSRYSSGSQLEVGLVPESDTRKSAGRLASVVVGCSSPPGSFFADLLPEAPEGAA